MVPLNKDRIIDTKKKTLKKIHRIDRNQCDGKKESSNEAFIIIRSFYSIRTN